MVGLCVRWVGKGLVTIRPSVAFLPALTLSDRLHILKLIDSVYHVLFMFLLPSADQLLLLVMLFSNKDTLHDFITACQVSVGHICTKDA